LFHVLRGIAGGPVNPAGSLAAGIVEPFVDGPPNRGQCKRRLKSVVVAWLPALTLREADFDNAPDRSLEESQFAYRTFAGK
jgi:hypothetical protein